MARISFVFLFSLYLIFVLIFLMAVLFLVLVFGLVVTGFLDDMGVCICMCFALVKAKERSHLNSYQDASELHNNLGISPELRTITPNQRDINHVQI